MNTEIRPGIRVALDASPLEADMAIASIDERGTPGPLNRRVTEAYGYAVSDYPLEEELKRGYFLLRDKKGNRKPILYVVTGVSKNVAQKLEQNLWDALRIQFGSQKNEKTTVWVGLMGLTSRQLTAKQSFEITLDILSEFTTRISNDVNFVISIPSDKVGMELYHELTVVTTAGHPRANSEWYTLFNKRGCAFYFAGAYWNGHDYADEFIEKSMWRYWEDDGSFKDPLIHIRPGDIIILKSAYPKNGESHLNVKAIGVVVQPYEVETFINVDWRIRDVSLEIAGLGSQYKAAFSYASTDDVIRILNYFQEDAWNRLFQPFASTSPPSGGITKIAGLLSDSEKGQDYLDISKDVTAFARVIAAKSFEPPLAIALFGKWGSGKSFFMRKLREQIEDLSLRNPGSMYCEGVVHIHFNAWSYMDANLWASFVSRIFEGLQEYIKNENLGEAKANSIKQELSRQLNVTKAGIEALQEKKETVEKQIKDLNQKRDNAKNTLNQKIADLKKNTAWKTLKNVDEQFQARQKIIDSLAANPTYVQTEAELKEIIPEKYWNNPKEAYDQARSAFTFLKEFFRWKKLGWNLLALAGILLIIFGTPIMLEALQTGISKTSFVIPQAGLSVLTMLGFAWKRAEIVYAKLQPLAASFWTIKQDYDHQRAEALADFEQQEKVLKLEIEKGKEEILLYTGQIQKAEIISTELEYKINNALASETLYSFIEERSKSDDYRKHLGIISIIRKDFEILNGLFTGHKSEIVKPEQAEKFREYFNKPVERIILYIDDLDRCPEDNVVQVLEAVNLLMAFPLFIVMVGVDPRWVKKALAKKRDLQFRKDEDSKDNDADKVGPADYLEKIFQVPFHLREARPESVKNMIRQLATTKPFLPPVAPPRKPVKDDDFPADTPPPIPDIPGKGAVINADLSDDISAGDELHTDIIENIEFLELTETEITLLSDMGEVVGCNPRAVKRFVNIFKIVKVHEDYAGNQQYSEEGLAAALFIIALSTGQYRSLIQSFENYLYSPVQAKKTLSDYLQDQGIGSDKDWLIKKALSASVILTGRKDILNRLKVEELEQYYRFIRRFTFKN